jgi:hypothetical protein
MKGFKRENYNTFGNLYTERNRESYYSTLGETPKQSKNNLIKSYYSRNQNGLNNFETAFSFNNTLYDRNNLLKSYPSFIYSKPTSVNKYNKNNSIFNNKNNANTNLFSNYKNVDNNLSIFKDYKPMKRYFISSLKNVPSLYDTNGLFLNQRKELKPLSKNQKLRISDNNEINTFKIFN